MILAIIVKGRIINEMEDYTMLSELLIMIFGGLLDQVSLWGFAWSL